MRAIEGNETNKVKIRNRVQPLVRILHLLTVLALTGCTANVRESHFFVTYNPAAPDEPTNFYRVDVSANATFSNARYIAGYYDERAVDLFFSEIKTTDQTIFKDSLKNPGSSEILKPLDPSNHGAFVMVMSTNADDIVNSISAFAESEVVGQAITRIANKDEIQKARASDAAASSEIIIASAFSSELSKLIEIAGSTKDEASARTAYLRLMQRLSAEAGKNQDFKDFDKALDWFQTYQSK